MIWGWRYKQRIKPMNWKIIEQRISAATQQAFSVEHSHNVSGGCINQAYLLEGKGQKYFVKLNSASGEEMFAAEAEGLQEMAKSNSVAVPQPICWGITDNQAFLVMSYFRSGINQQAVALLGEQLAHMHKTTQNHFGWHRDNTIGSTPQPNTYTASWVAFYREQRLGFQLKLAARNGFGGALQNQGLRLMEQLEQFFTDYQPQPSLLHGDLWSGNYAIQDNGQPIIFDPAVYYGDREADIAMTELFGGFSNDFYTAYQTSWVLDSGYSVRKTLYNVYHILNHANLFGGGYAKQAQNMMSSLLSELN